MVIIQDTPVLTGKVVKAIFEDDQASDLETLERIDKNYKARVAAWWAEVTARRIAKEVAALDYRTGWYVAANGGMQSDLESSDPHILAGWQASREADPAMRKVKVR